MKILQYRQATIVTYSNIKPKQNKYCYFYKKYSYNFSKMLISSYKIYRVTGSVGNLSTYPFHHHVFSGILSSLALRIYDFLDIMGFLKKICKYSPIVLGLRS